MAHLFDWLAILLILMGSYTPVIFDNNPKQKVIVEYYLHYCPVHPTRWAETIIYQDGSKISHMLSWDWHKRNSKRVALGQYDWER